MNNLDVITAEEINIEAKKWAKDLSDNEVKTNQIRNVYGAITKIRQDFEVAKKENSFPEGENYKAIEMDLILLKPKVAYAAGRDKKVRKAFYPLIEEAVTKVQSSTNKDKAVQNFIYLMESVVAYHKFFAPNNDK